MFGSAQKPDIAVLVDIRLRQKGVSLVKGINTQAVLAMRGAGYYSERTAGARDVINDARKMVTEALAQTPKTSSLRIADFGAADGGTSREMWDMVVSDLRANGDERQI